MLVESEIISSDHIEQQQDPSQLNEEVNLYEDPVQTVTVFEEEFISSENPYQMLSTNEDDTSAIILENENLENVPPTEIASIHEVNNRCVESFTLPEVGADTETSEHSNISTNKFEDKKEYTMPVAEMTETEDPSYGDEEYYEDDYYEDVDNIIEGEQSKDSSDAQIENYDIDVEATIQKDERLEEGFAEIKNVEEDISEPILANGIEKILATKAENIFESISQPSIIEEEDKPVDLLFSTSDPIGEFAEETSDENMLLDNENDIYQIEADAIAEEALTETGENILLQIKGMDDKADDVQIEEDSRQIISDELSLGEDYMHVSMDSHSMNLSPSREELIDFDIEENAVLENELKRKSSTDMLSEERIF